MSCSAFLPRAILVRISLTGLLAFVVPFAHTSVDHSHADIYIGIGLVCA